MPCHTPFLNFLITIVIFLIFHCVFLNFLIFLIFSCPTWPRSTPGMVLWPPIGQGCEYLRTGRADEKSRKPRKSRKHNEKSRKYQPGSRKFGNLPCHTPFPQSLNFLITIDIFLIFHCVFSNFLIFLIFSCPTWDRSTPGMVL